MAGLSLPVWAASFAQAGPTDNPSEWPSFCLLSCPEARLPEPLADFSLRAKKLAAICPPETVGCPRPEDYRFYTLDNHLFFRTALFGGNFWRMCARIFIRWR